MEWNTVVQAVAAALGGGALMKFWENYRQRQDKLEERRQQHNQRVREAHAQVIASYLKLLAVCEDLHTVSRLKYLWGDPDAPPEPDAPSPEEYQSWCEDHRQLLKALSSTSVETNARIAEALLLDSRAGIRVRLQALLNKKLPPPQEFICESVEEITGPHRDALDELIQLLTSETADKDALPAVNSTTPPALPPAS